MISHGRDCAVGERRHRPGAVRDLRRADLSDLARAYAGGQIAIFTRCKMAEEHTSGAVPAGPSCRSWDGARLAVSAALVAAAERGRAQGAAAPRGAVMRGVILRPELASAAGRELVRRLPAVGAADRLGTQDPPRTAAEEADAAAETGTKAARRGWARRKPGMTSRLTCPTVGRSKGGNPADGR
jgi:hypothetical protein